MFDSFEHKFWSFTCQNIVFGPKLICINALIFAVYAQWNGRLLAESVAKQTVFYKNFIDSAIL